jgi:hypothetical protein
MENILTLFNGHDNINHCFMKLLKYTYLFLIIGFLFSCKTTNSEIKEPHKINENEYSETGRSKMRTIFTEIIINASPEKVWNVLTEFDKYPEWNPFMLEVKGSVIEGEKIRVQVKPVGGSKMSFHPTVLAFEPEKEIRWIGRFLFRGLFDGEHKLELIDNGNNTITFRQSELFGGIFVPLLDLDKTRKGFILMNEKLKEIVEK